MLLDKQIVFHDSSTTAVTTAGRYAGTVIDLTQGGDNPGPGELELVVQVGQTANYAGGTSVAVSVETHTTNDFSSARTVLYSGPAVATASLVKGALVARIRLPRGLKQYLAVVLTGVGTFSAGKMDAFVTPSAQINDL